MCLGLTYFYKFDLLGQYCLQLLLFNNQRIFFIDMLKSLLPTLKH